jgi:hypothetical protein
MNHKSPQYSCYRLGCQALEFKLRFVGEIGPGEVIVEGEERQSSFLRLSFRRQFYRRGICWLPAAKQQIPRAPSAQRNDKFSETKPLPKTESAARD